MEYLGGGSARDLVRGGERKEEVNEKEKSCYAWYIIPPSFGNRYVLSLLLRLLHFVLTACTLCLITGSVWSTTTLCVALNNHHMIYIFRCSLGHWKRLRLLQYYVRFSKVWSTCILRRSSTETSKV